MSQWFEQWFDTPYYHQLYQYRDDAEAQQFLDRLVAHLDLAEGARICDLGCGKGRHARYLAERGFDVTGLDLSQASIDFASEFEHARLRFKQHDMRDPFGASEFDLVGTFFTAFGYFDDLDDDRRVLRHVRQALKTGGLYVLDFLNLEHARRSRIEHEVVQRGETTFTITRAEENGFLLKTIDVKAVDVQFTTQERVRAFDRVILEGLLLEADLKPIDVFGSYDLESWNTETSTRTLIIAQAI